MKINYTRLMFLFFLLEVSTQLKCFSEPVGWLWSRRTSWRIENVDGPLNGPASQSVTFIRQFVPPFYVPATVKYERAWVTLHGKKILFQDVANSIDSYCSKQPEFKKWKLLQAFMDNQQQRFAPAKFWIVSIDPITVILTPFDIQKPDNHSNEELSGAISEQMEMRAPMSSILVNCYNFGTEIENASSIQWFVVGSNQGIVTEKFNGKELTLVNGDLVLKLTKSEQNIIKISRISKSETNLINTIRTNK